MRGGYRKFEDKKLIFEEKELASDYMHEILLKLIPINEIHLIISTHNQKTIKFATELMKEFFFLFIFIYLIIYLFLFIYIYLFIYLFLIVNININH